MKKKTIAWIIGVALIFSLVGYGIGTMGRNGTEPIEEPIEEPVDEEIKEDVTEDVDEEVVEETYEVNQNLADWIPRLDNVIYHYEGFGNEYASFKRVPQFNQENYYQIATDNSGTIVVDIFEYRADEIVRIFSRPETYFRDNFTTIGTIDEYADDEIILKLPIAVGTSWSTDEANYEITAIEKEIEVPAGNFETIEVTIEFDEATIKRYYAEKIGLIYEWTEVDEFEVESKLDNIQKDTPETISLTVYQVDEQVLGLEQIPAEIQLNTNDPARIALQELLTGEKTGFEGISLLPKGTKINYLFLNDEGIVEIDLSNEYITNVNTGSSGESFSLSGLGNTFAQYYGVEKVRLTIDGENYEGGHILLGDDDYLIFDESIINE